MSTIPSIAMIPSGYKANKVYSVLPTDGAADLTFARTSTANRVNSNNLIEEVATGVPRLDYTDGTCPSLLLEPQSANLITYPLSFDNASWTKSGASVTGGFSAPSVDNPTSAFKLVEDTSSGEHYIQGNVTKIDNTTYSSSYYVKALTNNYGFRISPIAIGSSVAVSNANFSITNGVPILNSVSGLVLSASIKLLQDDFYRVSVIYTLDGTVSSHGSRFYLRTQATFTGDGTSGVYIFGAQLEEQSFATSLMLPNTEGSTVTRVAETNTKDVSSLSIGNAHTIFIDSSQPTEISNEIIYELSGCSIRNYGGGLRLYNATDADYPFSAVVSSNNKYVFRINGGVFTLFYSLNGVETSLSGTFATQRGLTDIIIYGSFSPVNINDFRVYNTSLTDTEANELIS